MKPEKWHGLTAEQALALWDQTDWREKLGARLRQIAESSRCTVEQRMNACGFLNQALALEVLPKDPLFAQYLIVRMVEILRQGEAIGIVSRWWNKRARYRAAADLATAQWMLRTAVQLVMQTSAQANIDADGLSELLS